MAQAYDKFWLKCIPIVFFGLLMQVCESRVLIEGDIMVGSTLGRVSTSKIESMRLKRNAVRDKEMIWDSGVIPYEIDMRAGFDDNIIAKIMTAIKQWENSTCIIFVERNAADHENYVRFTSNILAYHKCSCCANVGKIGGVQEITINGCPDDGIAHELGHTIGFHHEHQRPDRDDYIELLEVNNGVDFEDTLKKWSHMEVDTLDEPYDFDSIMHYKQLRMVPKKLKNGNIPKINQRWQLSEIDIRKTNKLYKCPKCGQTYFNEEAAFTSPEYYVNKFLKKSPNRTIRCEWRIRVMDGEQIRLDITDLDIFESSDCKSDYLEIWDGYWHKSPLLGRFCGSNLPQYIVTFGNRMIMNYVSSHIEYRGFAANYQAFTAW